MAKWEAITNKNFGVSVLYRSDVPICDVDDPEDANEIARKLNTFEEMLAALRVAQLWAHTLGSLYPEHERDGGDISTDLAAIQIAIENAEATNV